MKFLTTILCMAACSLLVAEDPFFLASTGTSNDTSLIGTVEKGHCHRGERGHRGKRGHHGKRGHVGPLGPQGPGFVSEYFDTAFIPPGSAPFDTAQPLPLGTASVISSGLAYDGVNTVTVQVPGKYLIEYSISFFASAEIMPSHIFVDTEYGSGGATVVTDSFPILSGIHGGPDIVGTRELIVDLQQNDILRLSARISEGTHIYPNSYGTTPAIVLTMSRVG